MAKYYGLVSGTDSQAIVKCLVESGEGKRYEERVIDLRVITWCNLRELERIDFLKDLHAVQTRQKEEEAMSRNNNAKKSGAHSEINGLDTDDGDDDDGDGAADCIVVHPVPKTPSNPQSIQTMHVDPAANAPPQSNEERTEDVSVAPPQSNEERTEDVSVAPTQSNEERTEDVSVADFLRDDESQLEVCIFLHDLLCLLVSVVTIHYST